MARKKQKPFNPFAKDAAAQKKRPSFQKPRDHQKPAPARRSPATLDPLPSAIKDSAPKPAIPQSFNPKTSDKPVVEEQELTTEDEIIEESPPVESIGEESIATEIEVAETTTPEGPATAVGKVRGIGLRQKQQEKETDGNNDSDEVRVSELIAESKALAVDSGMKIDDGNNTKEPISKAAEAARSALVEKKSASEKAFEKRSKMIAKKRKTRASSAPSKRIVKLNRRKYMEFKVDVREIMEEENVDEEHRANLLGSTWAKGERQGIDAAIEFVEQKLEDEIISDMTAERIIKVLKGYRKVR